MTKGLQWDKIQMENLIYARSAVEHSAIWERKGCLLGRNVSDLLQTLLNVYNRFFAGENRRFLRQESDISDELVAEEYSRFLWEREAKPILSGEYLTPKIPLRIRGRVNEKRKSYQ